MIDELAKPSEPRQVIIETERRKGRREDNHPVSSKKIVGGIINRANERTEASSLSFKVSWEWHKRR